MDIVDEPNTGNSSSNQTPITDTTSSSGTSIPTWAWGAAAGAAVFVSGITVSTYHFAARYIRRKKAREAVLDIIHGDATPRGLPSTPFDPSPPRSDSPYVNTPENGSDQ